MSFCFNLLLKCPCVKLSVFEFTHYFPVILPSFLYTHTHTSTHAHTKHFLWLQMWEPLKKRSLGHNTQPMGLCTFSTHTHTHLLFYFSFLADCSFKWLPVSSYTMHSTLLTTKPTTSSVGLQIHSIFSAQSLHFFLLGRYFVCCTTTLWRQPW